MNQRRLRTSFLAIPALIAGLSSTISLNDAFAAGRAAPIAEVGKAAPAFTLKDVSGKNVSLKDFTSKIVVLEWFDDVCPFVKKHYKSGNMQGLQRQFSGKGIIWLVINSSGRGRPGSHDEAESRALMKKWKFATPYFLLDPDGIVGHQYGAKTTPHMFVIGKDGTLLYTGAIDDKPDTDAESIPAAKNYVREALAEVLEARPVTVTCTKPYG
jgi:peroxiredoxin